MYPLYDWQDALVEKVRMKMRTVRRVCLQSPTGSGKTRMFTNIADRVYQRGKRVYAVAHRIEIVNQISAAFSDAGIRHGVIAPDRYETGWSAQVAMVQTLANRLARVPRPDLLILDEGHHAVSETYLKILRHWEGVHILIVTATPRRLDGRGLSEIADALVLGPYVRWLIDHKYLADYRYIGPPIKADLSNLQVRLGDYISAQTAEAMSRGEVIGDVAAHYRQYFDGAPAVLFSPDVATARRYAEALRAQGWKAASLDGTSDPSDRRKMIGDIGNGTLNVLCSCSIVDEGTDLPEISGIIDTSPTMSLTRYLQRNGRALRVKKDGRRAIIMDHVGNGLMRHGMPDFKHKWTLEGTRGNKGQRAPAVRQCPKCYLCFPPAPKCPGCGHEFPAIANVGLARVASAPGELTELAGDWLMNGPLNQVVKSATTYHEIDMIRKARGYHPSWTRLQMNLRNGNGATSGFGRGRG